MDKEKLRIDNSYYFLLLDKNYNKEIKEGFVHDFKNKNFVNISISLNEMLSEIDRVNDSRLDKYMSYYESYEQILSFDEYLSSRKELARNVINNLKNKIEKNKVEEEDFLPFLEYFIFREYSLYFKSEWYCLPYLRFSNVLLYENKINFDEIFNVEKELYKVNAFDFFDRTNTGYDNDEYQNFLIVNEEQASFILELMKTGTVETNNEFYLMYNTLLKAKNNDYILLYTIY